MKLFLEVAEHWTVTIKWILIAMDFNVKSSSLGRKSITVVSRSLRAVSRTDDYPGSNVSELVMHLELSCRILPVLPRSSFTVLRDKAGRNWSGFW